MILDAGPFIDTDRVNSRLFALIKRALQHGEELHTTHPVLAQVIRDPARQANLFRAVRGFTVHAFDDATTVGRLLAETDTSDVIDAHLATLAQMLDTFIVTTDPDDMATLGARFEEY